MVKYYYKDEYGRIFPLSKQANKTLNDFEKAKKIVKCYVNEIQKEKAGKNGKN